jgi:hypothetical protein
MARASDFNSDEIATLRARLLDHYFYDPETGWFKWIIERRGRHRAKIRAGWVSVKGYRYIRVDRRSYKASRMAWLYFYGALPASLIDHKNGDKGDDRIANLREADNSKNMANRKKNSNSASPFKGVLFRRRKGWWIARLQINNRRIERSGFKTPEAAHEAYKRLATEHFGEFARFG